MIRIKYKIIRSLSLFYLLIPFFIFLATWIKGNISFPCILFLGYGIFRQHGETGESERMIRFSVCEFVLVVVVSFIWCWSAGIGGFFYQSPDHHFRNAVFHDLISYRWPVIYESYGTGLVYYLGIWIVPAVFGKMLLKMNFSDAMAWNGAEIALLIWCSIGIILLVILLCLYFRQQTLSGIITLLLILIGFSGLDIIGELWKNGLKISDHIEWWSEYFQFRSNTTALFWAYNQAIPCWIMTMLLLTEDNVRNYGLIMGSALFYTPFSVIGISICVVVIVFQEIRNLRKKKEIRQIVLELCSVQNLAAIASILPVLLTFYCSNAGAKSRIRFCWNDYGGLTKEIVEVWLVFLLLEMGVYICFFIKTEHKNPLIYAVLISLSLHSVISIGEIGEVAYRISATMPMVFILMCFVIKAVFSFPRTTLARSKLFYVSVILVSMVGSVTPTIEYYRAITAITEQKTICAVADDIKTLNTESAPQNFICNDIEESFFYRMLAK